MKHLNPRKATEAANIPAWRLQCYAEELIPVVHDIVTESVAQCKYPTMYKHAIVSPIPKIRPPTDLDRDFRQVSHGITTNNQDHRETSAEMQINPSSR